MVVEVDDHDVPLYATASPPALTARQNVDDTHDTASSGNAPASVGAADHDDPVNVTARPSRLTARQNDAETHDTPVGVTRPVGVGNVQDPPVSL